ncbi:MAG: hypothetical protein Q9222_002967 [Ikaeria aurantiellina]
MAASQQSSDGKLQRPKRKLFSSSKIVRNDETDLDLSDHSEPEANKRRSKKLTSSKKQKSKKSKVEKPSHNPRRRQSKRLQKTQRKDPQQRRGVVHLFEETRLPPRRYSKQPDHKYEVGMSGRMKDGSDGLHDAPVQSSEEIDPSRARNLEEAPDPGIATDESNAIMNEPEEKKQQVLDLEYANLVVVEEIVGKAGYVQ